MNKETRFNFDETPQTSLEQISILEINNDLTNSNMMQATEGICIHQLVEIQVTKTPDAVAVIFEDRQLTYRELNQKANQLAHYLIELGVKPEVLVGVCVERSLEMIVALLAILKAGGAYVPLDPAYPQERLTYMLEDSQAKVLLTQSYSIKNLSQGTTKLICLDSDVDAIGKCSINNPQSEVTRDHLAYVIYTSGSTGKPKGVAMPHAPLCNLLNWQLEQSSVSVGSRTLQFTPISFDVSFQEIFSTLATGGILVLISEQKRRDPLLLLKFLRDNFIERLFLPFVALKQLAEVAERESNKSINLKEVITAGEQLRITSAIAQWFGQMPNCTLHNHYGPSESHVVTAFTLTGSPQEWPVLPPIGRPIANTQIHILDSQLKPVPIGVTGELYIGGICLAKGYLNRPELTAEKFIPDHLSQQPGERLYKTGDLARHLPDGNIEYMGRIDQQVKISGYRVEPGEIEAALEQYPQVREAVIITRDSIPGDKRHNELGNKRLVAYIVLETKASTIGVLEAPLARKLRQFLRTKLPNYMVPSAFMLLDEFPLTPSGKIDRRALPIPKWTRTEEGVYVAPRNELESQLADIWTQLLGIEQVGIHDNFCELGGHSLLAVQLITEVNKAFQLDLPMESFLKAPTIIGLAQTINTLRRGAINNWTIDKLETEAVLDPSIYPENILNKPIPRIFLTGATGILGSSLLYELLCQTQADVYCLVRATRIEEGQARIQNSLKRYLLWNDALNARIIPVLGDLSKPQLGIEPKQFSRLAEKIDVIYHCGALVNIVYPYSALKASNVLGTQEVLRLASKTKIKPVHFISTVDVFSSANTSEFRTIYEQDAIGPGKHLYSGYAQSKYIAEQLVKIASSRGLPVSIYRPSNIIGDNRTGIQNTNSFVALMIKGCIQMGLAPELKAVLNLVPVDYVSQAIVHLAQYKPTSSQSFNIVNCEPVEWKQLIHWIIRTGYPIKQVSYETWYSQLLKYSAYDSENILTPLASLFTNQPFIQKLLGAFYFEQSNTLKELANHHITCSLINEDLLNNYFSYFTQSGFLHSPLVASKWDSLSLQQSK
jgi:amino acid adenylation domain-containing protein/thioester reductase-like protein